MKKNKVIFWIVTSILFVFEGLMPVSTLIFAHKYFNAGTKPLGYPDYFAYALIICKFSGATAIMIPIVPAKVKEWAYAGMTFNLVFAVLSHAAVDGNVSYIMMPFIIGGLLMVSYINNLKIIKNG